jgi:hypothetical protein
MIASAMVTSVGTFPAVYVKQLMPRQVPVPAQVRAFVPPAERTIAFQPVGHVLGAPVLGTVMGRWLIHMAYLFVSCGLRRIQKQQATGYERYSKYLVHINLRFLS